MIKTNKPDTDMPRRSIRRLREKKNRYNTILKAAEKLFSKKGFNQTSIEEIADLAEVSTGAVYFYFKNKDDLLIKLMHEIGHYLRKLLGKEFEKTDLTLNGFNNIPYAFLKNFCMGHPEKITIFFRESVGQSLEVEEQRKQLFVKLTLDIKDAITKISKEQGKNFISDFSIELIAVCIVGIYERVACHYFLWQDGSKNIQDIAEETASFMLGGINSLFKTGL